MDILENTIYDIPLINWIAAGSVLALVYLLAQLFRTLLLRRMARGPEGDGTGFEEFLESQVRTTRWYFLLALALYLAVTVLNPPPGMRELARLLVISALLIQLALWGQNLISFLINRRMRKRLESDPSAATTLNAFNLVARITLWTIIILLVLDNLPGIQVTSLIASLGITGVAVALAVQNILGDLFASLSIALDKPFVIGDSIIVDQYNGTVEHIGLKSTRVRSLEGEQLVFSNSDLLSSRIRNFKRMARRRVQFPLRVRHGTPPEKLARVPDLLREIVNENINVTFDRAHFKEIGESALLFEVVYYIENPDYTLFMDIQQEINLGLSRRFTSEGIQFAFPTQSVILENSNGLQDRVLTG